MRSHDLNHPDLSPDTAETVHISVDGECLAVPTAASLAAVLAQRGIDGLRMSRPGGALRGVFCGMGACYECAVTVAGVVGVRACLTPVAAGMRVETGRPR